MVALLTLAQAGNWSALVPGSNAFLAAVLLFGTFAVVFRAVSWLASTDLDRLLLGLTYAAGLVGFVATRDLALAFAPPTATLA
ncbi:hypothetical protein [Natrinema pallidum]|nr:hypothetical protein [Natrinema pallidum]QCW03224.1 hypothetical protein FGF80_08240 [Natrinema pallidum]